RDPPAFSPERAVAAQEVVELAVLRERQIGTVVNVGWPAFRVVNATQVFDLADAVSLRVKGQHLGAVSDQVNYSGGPVDGVSGNARNDAFARRSRKSGQA